MILFFDYADLLSFCIKIYKTCESTSLTDCAEAAQCFSVTFYNKLIIARDAALCIAYILSHITSLVNPT